MKYQGNYIHGLMLLLLLLGSCATQKNTGTTRWWKGFKSRYNTYFNGHQAYLEGMQAKLDGNKDNYTDFIPLLMVSNKSSEKLGSGSFDITVTKCEKTIKLYSIKTKPEIKSGHRMTPKEKAFRNRSEFNPFLKNAWILMGKAQMEEGNFIEAASTFSYTERLYQNESSVANVARSLLALCYTQLDWYYDAEELFRKIRRDSIPRAARRDYNTAVTNFYLRQKRWKDAVPYLQEEIKNLPHGIPKARGCFLLGQVCKTLDMRQEAYDALQKCMRQSPPYEMRFNAQILQTEVIPNGNNQKKLAKLKRMAKKDNNKNYLEQVYYAIGNVYLALPDTAKAIEAYETGVKKAVRNSISKGVLLMNLGDLYWAKESFADAQRCYRMAVSCIGKEHERYESLTARNAVLSKLVPFTSEIHLQDSVQGLVHMSEKDRNAAIDKVIAYAKIKQKQEKRTKADSLLAKNHINTQSSQLNNNKNTLPTENTGGMWYFYNQQTVNQGMEQFKQLWGERANEDNWRRVDKTGNTASANNKVNEIKNDTTKENNNEQVNVDKLNKNNKKEEGKDSLTNGPLSRAYYMAQLPFTKEKLAASNQKLADALFHAAVIEKDEMGNYRLSRKTFMRLYTNFPDFKQMDEVFYHLFLLELHWGTRAEADGYRNMLAEKFPKSEFTKLITAPDFEENAKYGKHLEDSIYVKTYEAYRKNDYATMARNCKISKEKYPQGENRAKFMFLDAMTLLRKGDARGFVQELKDLAKDFPQDKITDLANSITKNIQEGRVPATGNFDMSSLWDNRNSSSAAAADSISRKDTLQADRNSDYVFILSYSKDSLNEGQLLYDVSRFNFTNFNVRNFDIEIISSAGKNQMRLTGFISYDEVHRYEQELFQDSACRVLLEHVNPILISQHNLKLIGVKYTMQEYEKFYQKNFVPSKVKKDLKIDEQPNNFIWDEFEKVDKKDENKQEPTENDGGEWY